MKEGWGVGLADAQGITRIGHQVGHVWVGQKQVEIIAQTDGARVHKSITAKCLRTREAEVHAMEHYIYAHTNINK